MTWQETLKSIPGWELKDGYAMVDGVPVKQEVDKEAEMETEIREQEGMDDEEMDEKMEAVERLEEIKGEMLELLGEARELVRRYGDEVVYARAKGYWLAHVETALTRDHMYLGSSMYTMEDSINELAGREPEEG